MVHVCMHKEVSQCHLGFPLWLHFIPGIAFRTNNEPFKAEMERFTSKVVEMMKEENLFYSQGGPIILAQIENEYGNVNDSYGEAGKAYMKWAAGMAVGLDTGVPWIMCQQADAPDPIINTCNGFYCHDFTPNSIEKPKMWTENWSGWFQKFGGDRPYRPVQDLAFAVAHFFERGGTLQNYYMYHGGTNFGRTSGGPYISTSYDYDAPLDEYGLCSCIIVLTVAEVPDPFCHVTQEIDFQSSAASFFGEHAILLYFAGNVNQPKWGHLRDLHLAIQLCEPALVLHDPISVKLGSMQEGHIYTNGDDICAAFLANNDSSSDATVLFKGRSYQLPAWSVSVLPDCKSVVFNSAQVNAQSSILTTTGGLEGEHLRALQNSLALSTGAWKISQEPIGEWGNNSFVSAHLLEQINTTKDTTDYLWYSTSVVRGDSDSCYNGTGKFTLNVSLLGHLVHVFVNQKLSGSGSDVQLEFPIQLNFGKNKIDLLSTTVGLQNYGAYFDTWGAGVSNVVLVDEKAGKSYNLSSQNWVYQVGLQGETLHLYKDFESSGAWISVGQIPRNEPMVWYKTTFNALEGNDPVALDLSSMGKGRAWVNGQDIGRYWPAYIAPQTGCSSTCPYQGAYSSSKCLTNCGKPSQSRYHVPRSWLFDSGNTLVLFEEIGGDPTNIVFVPSSVTSVCAHVSESHALPLSTLESSNTRPLASLDCGLGKTITDITFASYGTPEGTCGRFLRGSCHSSKSMFIVGKACVGQRACAIPVSNDFFRQDPCRRTLKSLAIEAQCS